MPCTFLFSTTLESLACQVCLYSYSILRWKLQLYERVSPHTAQWSQWLLLSSTMQKISLKVLLRFLSRYSHWNLVRRADCYHLYFVTKESSTISPFPASRYRQREQRGRRLASKLHKDSREVVPFIKKPKKAGNKESKKKDLFVIYFQRHFQYIRHILIL